MTLTKYKNINPAGIKLTMGCDTNTSSQQKTRMCHNIITSGSCQFGSACHYAHTFSELRIMDCAYSDKCVFVEYTENKCCVNKNTGDKSRTCYFRHPTETNTAYHIRVGNMKQLPKPPTQLVCQPCEKPDPIVIELGDTWSQVVRRVQPTLPPLPPLPKEIRSVNPYDILKDGDRTPQTFPSDDMDGIMKFVNESLAQQAPVITIKIDY